MKGIRVMIAALAALLCISSVATAVPQMPLAPTGHGALDGVVVVLDPGHGATDPGCHFTLKQGNMAQEYWEAAYTYAAALDLGAMIRAEGGKVYLTCWSDTAAAFKAPNAQTPRPLPRDAVFTDDGSPAVTGANGGLRHRAEYCSSIYQRLGQPEHFYFLSLHIDAMGSGNWAGSHVCLDKNQENPGLAYTLESRIKQYGCPRTLDEVPQALIAHQGLGVLRTNEAPQAALLEMCLPSNSKDSWRIRNDANRERYLKGVPLAALIDMQNPAKVQAAIASHGQPVKVAKSSAPKAGGDEWNQPMDGAPIEQPEPSNPETYPPDYGGGFWGGLWAFTGLGPTFTSFWWLALALVSAVLTLIIVATVDVPKFNRGKITAKDGRANLCWDFGLIFVAIMTCYLGSWFWAIYWVLGVSLASAWSRDQIREGKSPQSWEFLVVAAIVPPMFIWRRVINAVTGDRQE